MASGQLVLTSEREILRVAVSSIAEAAAAGDLAVVGRCDTKGTEGTGTAKGGEGGACLTGTAARGGCETPLGWFLTKTSGISFPKGTFCCSWSLVPRAM